MRTKLVVILTFSYLFLSVVATQRVTFAQETTTRLYIPTSNQTMLVKDAAKTSLVVKDYLGSSRAVDQNNTMQVEEYYPYGADVKDMDIDVDRKFTGHRELDDAGVYHAGARFYNQELGIFVQADKVEGPNRYGYVQGNPISNNDPTGHSSSNNMTESQRVGNPLPDFPHALPLQDIRYAELYNDPLLPKLAEYYTKKNPYDPVKNKKEFVEYLSKDIYESSSYNKDLARIWRQQSEVESSISYMSHIDQSDERFKNIPVETELQDLYQAQRAYDKEEKQYHREYKSLSLGQRMANCKSICADFTAFTGYVLAKNGIATAVGGTDDLQHAFGVVEIGNVPYVYDTTWGGGQMHTFFEDRTGQNKWRRHYETWDFQTPWGNNFEFNLQNTTDEDKNDGLSPYY
jgi:RHS repeat-associated protein